MTSRHPSPPRAMRCRAGLPLLAIGIAGCVDLGPLRTGDYPQVTLRQLEAAAAAGDPQVSAGVVGLLERRLATPAAVEVDLALEALVALLHLRPLPADAAAVAVRCGREDASEEVRYLALEVVAAVAPGLAEPLLAEAAVADDSELVRAHARALRAR